MIEQNHGLPAQTRSGWFANAESESRSNRSIEGVAAHLERLHTRRGGLEMSRCHRPLSRDRDSLGLP
jgi:hypothetical protein